MGCLREVVGSLFGRFPMSLNGHVSGVLMPVWGGAGPSLQFIFAFLVCHLQACGTRISSWGLFICGDFYRSSGKPSIPTLLSLSWGMLYFLNTACVIWWIGQGE